MITIDHFFTNDLGVAVSIPVDHELCSRFIERSQREIGLRRIHSYLFTHNMIDGNILDSGCWIGDNTIPWSRITKNTIYAIDPSAYNCDFIRLLVKINNITNVTIIQKGLSRHNVKIFTNDDINHGWFTYGEVGNHVIDSVSLDYLDGERLIENIACIHLDVEGMEQEVVLGAGGVITKYKPIITFEQHLNSDNYSSLCRHLQSYGYDIYLINEYLVDCRIDCRNFLAVPSSICFDNHISRINEYCQSSNLLLKME